MKTRVWAARNLAAALLAGVWTPTALARRAEQFLGRSTRKSQRELIRILLQAYSAGYPPSPAWLTDFLLRSPQFDLASGPVAKKAGGTHSVLKPAKFIPAEPFKSLDVPKLATPGDLAKWLDITIEDLDWFADGRRQHGRTAIPILQHYSYAFAPKRSGPPRLIEAPKPRLKAMQKRILHDILDTVPVHPCAHGFVAGRSCLSAAQMHAGEFLVLAVDLKEFFLNTPLQRVHGIFRSVGYPWAVARLLTGLCSSSTPQSVFMRLPEANRHDWLTRKVYEAPHLPQGAPTSPALTNLVAWRLDVRLQGLAATFEARYTRYADDLAFSGDETFARKINTFLTAIQDIAQDEGFKLNARKTRIMRRNGRQGITGVVINEHLNVPRPAYDALKATLHNCVRNGPGAENRTGHHNFRAHLDGRVTWVENVNPARGARLRKVLNDVTW